jgi:hypothetical protein
MGLLWSRIMSTWNNAQIKWGLLRKLSTFLFPLVLAFILIGCNTEELGWQEDNETEQSTDADSAAPPSASQLIKEASAGDTVILSAGTYEESLTLPAGIHLCGADHETVIIQPPAGEPGIEVTGAGQSRICNLTVQKASGFGIVSTEADLELEEVTTQNTSALDKDTPGHGVHIQNAATLKAINLKSIDNEGAGLSVMGVESVSIIVPEYIPSPELDTEKVGIIVPEYMPRTPDGETAGSAFKGNGQNGIIIIVPEYLEGYGESEAVETEALLGGLYLSENMDAGIALMGVKSTIDQCRVHGTVAPSTPEGETLEWTDKKAGHGVVALDGGTLHLHHSVVSENAGIGILSHGLRKTWIADNTEAPHDPSLQQEQVGIIVPEYMPGNSVLNNEKGGIAIVDPIGPDAEKADEASLNHWIAGVEVRGNKGYGVSLLGANARISRSVIHESGTEGSTAATGVYINHAPTAPEKKADVQIDETNLIKNNRGAGVRVLGGSHLLLNGEISQNTGGGVRLRNDDTSVEVQEGAFIAANRVVGISALSGTSLTVKGATLAANIREEGEGELNTQSAFGDGIWAVEPANLTVENTLIRDHERAGIILLDAHSDNLQLKEISFSSNLYGLVFLLGGAQTSGPWPGDTCEGCTYDDNELGDETSQACLPIYNEECDEEGNCEPFYPCGECALACGDDEACVLSNCSQPTNPSDCSDKEDEDSCDDGDECTLDDACLEGICLGTPMVCDEGEGNPCKAAVCNSISGACVTEAANENEPCVNPSLCVIDSICQDGFCVGPTLDCDDDNPCTTELCNQNTGACEYTALPVGSNCDDNSKCTTDDACSTEGNCKGTPLVCNDTKDCTVDDCAPGTGCYFMNKANDNSCDDGNPCTSNDLCDGSGNCFSGEFIDCNDDNPCTTDSCAPTGECSNEFIVGCIACPGDGYFSCPANDNCPTYGENLGGIVWCDDGFLANTECTCLEQEYPCSEAQYASYGNVDNPGFKICATPKQDYPGVIKIHVEQSAGYPPQPGTYHVKFSTTDNDPVQCWENGTLLYECNANANNNGNCVPLGGPFVPDTNQAFDIPDISVGQLFNNEVHKVFLCVGNPSLDMHSGTLRISTTNDYPACPNIVSSGDCVNGQLCADCDDGQPCTDDFCDVEEDDGCNHEPIPGCIP